MNAIGKYILSYLISLIILTASSASSECLENDWKTATKRFMHGNRNRKYHINYDPDYIPNPPDPNYRYPVITALHGYSGSAETIARGSKLHLIAPQSGYVLVYPEAEGIVGQWNAGSCCGNLMLDDAGFLMAIFDELENNIPIDRNRLYFTGHSNGAHMAYRMACQYPDKIAAIATSAGTPYFVDPGGCIDVLPLQQYPKQWDDTNNGGDCAADKWYTKLVPQNPQFICPMTERVVPVFMYIGYTDPQQRFQGGKAKATSVVGPPAIYEINWYAQQLGGCSNVDILTILDYGKNDASTSELITYWNQNINYPTDITSCVHLSPDNTASCTNVAEVTVCISWDGGHTWAGTLYNAPNCCEPCGPFNPWPSCQCPDNTSPCTDCSLLYGNVAYSGDLSLGIKEFFDRHSL